MSYTIDDFELGDKFIVTSTHKVTGLIKAQTIYTVVGKQLEEYSKVYDDSDIDGLLRVHYDTHLIQTKKYGFPNEDSWNNRQLNTKNYTIEKLDKNINAEYFL